MFGFREQYAERAIGEQMQVISEVVIDIVKCIFDFAIRILDGMLKEGNGEGNLSTTFCKQSNENSNNIYI